MNDSSSTDILSNVKKPCSIKDSIKSLSKTSKLNKDFERSYQSPNDSIAKKPELGGTVSGTWKDKWDVARLPANIEKISKPSKRLETFLKGNEVSHTKAIEKMTENMQNANLNFEESYRYNGELLKKFLAKEKDKVEEIVKETLLEPKDTIVFGAIKYSDVSKAICNYGTYCTEAIEKFYNSVLFLEKQRCDSYRTIFKSSYSEISQISYMMPFQIQEYFEIEIVKFNEILLQNYRCYAELDMILKTDLEQNKTIWHQKFNRNKTKWVQFFKSHGYETNMLQKISDLDVESLMSFVSVTIQDKYKEILATVTELDELVNDALRKCKFILLKIYYEDYNELNTMDEDFIVPTNAASRDQLMQFKEELKNIMHKFAAERLLKNEFDDENFKTIIQELKERVKLTDKFFDRVAHLWDAHYEREAELNDLVTKHIEVIMEEHEATIQGVRMQLNIYNDNCRSAPTMDELQKNFGYTVAALKKCAYMYNEQMDREQQVLVKYLEMVDTEADILVAEMELFLAVCQPDYDHPDFQHTKESVDEILRCSNLFKGASMVDSQSMNSSCIFPYMGSETSDDRPPHIKYIDFKITSLDNWKYGIWETIEAKMRECKEEMMEKARAWTEPHKKAIDLRCKTKLDMNKIEFHRFWLTVYYMRYIELQRHGDRLEKHLKGINNNFEDLLESRTKILKDQSLLVDRCVKDLQILEQEVKSAKSTFYILSTTAKMKVIKENFRKEMDKLKESFTKEGANHEYVIQKTNYDYLKNILMFSESGNFHVDEVKQLSQQLQKAEKDFFKKSERCQKEFLTQIQKMSQKIQVVEGSFKNVSNHMKDEFIFQDNVNNCMNTLQTGIKNAAYNLKYKRKTVEAHIEKFNELASKLKGNFKKEDINFFTAKCNEVVKNFDEWYLVLNRTEEYDILPDIRQISLQRKESKVKAAKSSSQVRIVEKEGKSGYATSRYGGSNISGVNATGPAFYSCAKPIEIESRSQVEGRGFEIGQGFNDTVVNLLIEKLEQMRSIGQSFYTTVGLIVNKDRIEATFEEFSGNVMAKCGYFQIQCDAMWLEEAIEYTKLTAIFRNGLLKSYSIFLNYCLEYNQTKYQSRFSNLQEMLNDVERNATDEIKKIHTRLKPLHGFPKNKELLDKLYEEFSKQFKIYEERIYESIGNFKEDHIDLKDFIIEKLSNLDEAFQTVLESDEMKNLNRDMFAQIFNLFTKLKLLKTKNNNTTIASVEDKEMVTAKIASERFSVYTSTLTVLPIPEEYMARFSVLSVSNSIESVSGTFDFDDNVIEYIDLDGYSKKLDRILANHLETIGNFESRILNNCEKWEAIWQNDVEIIKNLYTVKYSITSNTFSQTVSK